MGRKRSYLFWVEGEKGGSTLTPSKEERGGKRWELYPAVP